MARSLLSTISDRILTVSGISHPFSNCDNSFTSRRFSWPLVGNTLKEMQDTESAVFCLQTALNLYHSLFWWSLVFVFDQTFLLNGHVVWTAFGTTYCLQSSQEDLVVITLPCFPGHVLLFCFSLKDRRGPTFSPTQLGCNISLDWPLIWGLHWDSGTGMIDCRTCRWHSALEFSVSGSESLSPVLSRRCGVSPTACLLTFISYGPPHYLVVTACLGWGDHKEILMAKVR